MHVRTWNNVGCRGADDLTVANDIVAERDQGQRYLVAALNVMATDPPMERQLAATQMANYESTPTVESFI